MLPAESPERACHHMDRHDAARDGAMRGWISSKATSEPPYPQGHRRSGAHYSRWALPDVPKCSENVETVQIMAATLPQRQTDARNKASYTVGSFWVTAARVGACGSCVTSFHGVA